MMAKQYFVILYRRYFIFHTVYLTFLYNFIYGLVLIGPLHDPVAWYGINYAGTQVAQWDFQNKEKSGWTGASSFVLEVPLCNLRPSIINSVPRDRILQKGPFWSRHKHWIQRISCKKSHIKAATMWFAHLEKLT